ncbi:UbiA-like protein EboC [Robertkochia marina]|nr:UbiA-like protein EboC [Robertkochia marina]
MSKLKGYIQLTRPANLPTAVADIVAGVAVSLTLMHGVEDAAAMASAHVGSILLLCLASVLLYASGVVLNDYFDRNVDAIERPERPIPSGVIPSRSALAFGLVLMCLGVLSAVMVSVLSGVLALFLALTILLYDAAGKRHVLFGPLTMGACRGLNLLLGMSLFGEVALWWMAVIPILYIGAVTLVSRGEVNGQNRSHITLAFFMYLGVIASLWGLMFYAGISFIYLIPFLIVFAAMVLIPLWRAYKNNSPANIRKAVKAGVISLILLDACIAVIFAGWTAGLSIVLLLPASLFLAKQFAVT